MKEKEPRSPLVVVAAMLFLALFIVLPPLFRAYVPKEEEVVETIIKKHVLSCEGVYVNEKLKVIVKISYEDDVAVNNKITYMAYTPTEEDIKNDGEIKPDKTAKEEITYFKTISDIQITEGSTQTMVVITDDVVENNPEQVELVNYLPVTDVAISNYEAQGFTCSKVEL